MEHWTEGLVNIAVVINEELAQLGMEDFGYPSDESLQPSCGNICFYGKDLRPCRSLMFPDKLAGAKLVGSVCFNGTHHKACRSRLPLSICGVDLGDFLGGGFGELCRKVVTDGVMYLG